MAEYEKNQPKKSTIMCSTWLVITIILMLLPRPAMSLSSKKINFFKTAAASTSSSSSSPGKSAKHLFTASVETAKLRAISARALAYNLTRSNAKHGGRRTAVDDCLELLDISLEELDDVIRSGESRKPNAHDIQTWLSAALTNQVTCSDSLGGAASPAAGHVAVDVDLRATSDMKAQVDVLSKYISNALALHSSMEGGGGGGGGGGRRLTGDFPEWVTVADRKLLEASTEEIRPHAVVAKDGSGTHLTIGEAIDFAAEKAAGGRSVIYIKAGVYREYINIPTKQKYVSLIGAGKGTSVIVGSRNAGAGWSTYSSATVAAMGAGFIAKGVTIINDSGPGKQQAVALRVGGDFSVVYQCSVQGYQDSLYSYANRQFFRESDISGTTDFIFGNSAVVLQNCFLQPRGGQPNYITAQGRTDPNQNTGISIQGCTVSGGGTTYLGRPWKLYSRVVYMETSLGGVVSSAGWAPWSGSFGLSTLYYGEYQNTGAGASTSGRVRWPGVHSAMSVIEASKFTVSSFIAGGAWLPGTGVEYNAGL
ncbi:putative pectinesterase/pectinesterase inhibitor 35 [Apostasia shenzhenica]|uniref:Pectinesterase n=1 Tax=Apostasia shenzhenica TaxID=1088818 RepID=A0A2I0A1Z3_9ASPA|nr:putative pectinesterase/pectinesterase inhibitor 35 [Apostasia shenzhenica]